MHFANGVELLQASPPNYQDAFRQFQLAYQKTHGSWKVMGNLGLCALKLERDGEALSYYQGYLKDGGDQIDPDERSHIEREMLLIQGNMAHVALKSSQPDVRYSVSRQGSAVPPQIYEAQAEVTELGLRAGTLDITATTHDGAQLTFSVTLAAGEQAQHLFDYEAKPPAAATTSEPAPYEAPKKHGMSGLRIAGIATASVGVLALGGGVVTGLLSQSKEKNAKESCIGSVCKEDSEQEFDSAKTLATVANVLFISGGVLAATGITLVIVGGNKSDQSEALAEQRRAHASLHPAAARDRLGAARGHLVAADGRTASPLRMEIAPTPYLGGAGLLAFGTF